MRLEWMMLANHAEDHDGLLYMSGGSWDTINVNAPLVGGQLSVVALFQGFLVIRLLFHTTETGKDHSFTLSVLDEDGHEIQPAIEGMFRVDRNEDVPPGWDQGVNILIGLSGMPLTDFGNFTFAVQIDGNHLGDRPFRVVKRY